MTRSIADIRREYTLQTLRREDVDPDAFRQFERWFRQAEEAAVPEPTAMTLATASLHAAPTARMVLLKGMDERGFTFYTSFESKKANDMELNPRAALVFHWPELERQVRIEGRIERVSDAEADEYFRSRPRGSQLGAWASHQSAVIENREELENALQEVEQRFLGREVPRPPHWGGFRLVPLMVEFWQGRPNRLHDRIRYRREDALDSSWKIERLSP